MNNFVPLISGNFTKAMEKERSQHQLQTESAIERKSNLNIKGKSY